MANLTLSTTHTNPAALTTGNQTLVVDVSLSATTSIGDVIYLAALPHGAVVTEVVFIPQGAFVAGILKLGTSASNDLYLSSDTYSLMTHVSAGLGPNWKISVSDTAVVRYEYVTLGPTPAVLTVGFQCSVRLTYRMDYPAV